MISIIDYGAGNLANIKNAFDYLGMEASIVSKPEDLISAEKIVLPGVGAFSPAIKRLRETGFVEILRERINDGVPLLGICLGMQLLMSGSEENGNSKGLDFIKGKVTKLTGDQKIPHMGWNTLDFERATPLNKGIETGKYAYFVHSYFCSPEDFNVVTSRTRYGESFASIIEHENIYGMQFHPEKSQQTGLQLLKNFGSI